MDSPSKTLLPPREINLPSLGNRLREHRKAKGWSQRQLARRAGLRADRLSRLEQGATEPRLEEIAKLARALGMGLEDVVFGPSAAAEGERP